MIFWRVPLCRSFSSMSYVRCMYVWASSESTHPILSFRRTIARLVPIVEQEGREHTEAVHPLGRKPESAPRPCRDKSCFDGLDSHLNLPRGIEELAPAPSAER